MAYYNGTATDYLDLLDIICEKAELNDWVLVQDLRPSSPQVILKGVADSGTDEIYVGILGYAIPLTDTYGFWLDGYTGFQSGVSWAMQQGAIPNVAPNYLPTVALWNAPIDYWLCVNKRRIVCVVKISTLYFAFYLGYILPFASVNQFPYPLCVGGCNINGQRYDLTGDSQSVFVIPYQAGNLRLRDQSGVWQALGSATTGQSQHINRKGTFPYSEYFSNGTYYGWRNAKKVPNTGGDIFNIQPVLLFESSGGNNSKGNIYGQFDGIYHIGGLNNGAENDLTIASENYKVFPNIYRTTPQDFFALKLV